MPTPRKELRAFRKIEKRALTQAEKDAGYIGAISSVIPYNSDSGEIRERGTNGGRPFVEQVARGAFASSLESPEGIIAFVGHTDDPLAAFARAGANLTLTETADGLQWEALAPDTAACRDLVKLVDTGVIRGASFEFSVRGTTGEKWEKRGTTDVRIITDATLYAVNPVAWPAYEDSALTVAMRSHDRSISAYHSPDWYSPLVDDVSFAEASLAAEISEFSNAQRYLRENPTGAHVDYATRTQNECAGEIKTLVDWLAANGSKPDPTDAPDSPDAGSSDVMDRARKVLASHRSNTPPAAPTFTERALWAARFSL